jgi:hypothetical protein
MDKQTLVMRLTQMGMQEIETQRNGWRAFQGKGMLGDQYVIVTATGKVKTGNPTGMASVSLQPERFVAMLEKRMRY